MRRNRRAMGPQEGADVAHCQRDLVRGVLPRVEADLRVWSEMDALHRDGVGVRRDVVRQYQDRRLATLHEIARHGVDEIGVVPVHLGQERVDHRHRDIGPAFEFSPPPGMTISGKPDPTSW